MLMKVKITAAAAAATTTTHSGSGGGGGGAHIGGSSQVKYTRYKAWFACLLALPATLPTCLLLYTSMIQMRL